MVDEQLSDKELQAFLYIRNMLVHERRTPSIRELQKQLGYSSPRAAAYVLERLESKGYVQRPRKGIVRLSRELPESDSHAQTVNVPLVGSAPCGAPVYAEENVQAYIPVSKRHLRPGSNYFLLTATGDSMTERGIQDGDLVLVKQQPTANDGDIVVALINGEATIKEFHRRPNAVILKPRSKNEEHKPIILTEDFQVLGIIQSIIKL